ncbi:RIB43A-like with coiled-coils protein 2 [Boleophthalmus pectinirostris]|uniref:RIB43A-like with coiled-coils protein 2 n=1 Tax=Boleophthalmus pectinirostris TaxID=150288 RepID=UPI00242BB7FA|nr:RIB43A-like with coiled-coils protein 2 [Boleophthalmus pectinirostris]
MRIISRCKLGLGLLPLSKYCIKGSGNLSQGISKWSTQSAPLTKWLGEGQGESEEGVEVEVVRRSDGEAEWDAEMLHYQKVASILTHRQQKQQQQIAQDTVIFRQTYQQPSSRREFDLNDPDLLKNMSPEEAQMMIPGLPGEDPNCKDRQQRQREQLSHWLIQQQAEHKNYDQFMVEVNNMALELQNLEMENRKAEVMATKDFNLAMKKKRRQQSKDKDTGVWDFMDGEINADSPQSIVEKERKEILKLKEFQQQQMEEKKQKLSEENEQRYYDSIRIDSARTATLIERQQAKLNKQMRKHLDSTNHMLAETRKQIKPAISKGAVTESFFTQFNTCSR